MSLGTGETRETPVLRCAPARFRAAGRINSHAPAFGLPPPTRALTPGPHGATSDCAGTIRTYGCVTSSGKFFCSSSC